MERQTQFQKVWQIRDMDAHGEQEAFQIQSGTCGKHVVLQDCLFE